MTKSKFRRPDSSEQEVLDQLTVRPIRRQERRRFDALMVEHHYLKSNTLVGEQLCYVATYQGQWLALSSWCAAARYLKGRDQFIGWTPEQCRHRRALVANNARFVILPGQHLPNLASRTLKLVLDRLAEDWQERFKHPVVLVETFVDPEQFRGTTYQCSGWTPLGQTQGWGRQAKDYYVQHDHPKQLWVKALVKNAAKKLRADTLPAAWAVVETKVKPRCTAQSAKLKSLTDHLAQIPEYRSAHALGYPLAGLLTLVAVAMFCGVVRGKKDLAQFASTLSQGQMRALRFRRRDKKTGQLTPPGVTTFFRILNEVDQRALELALLAWQDQVLGPVQDQIIAVDGKKLRHSQGGELVSAVGVQSGRWLGTVRTPDKTNEIIAACSNKSVSAKSSVAKSWSWMLCIPTMKRLVSSCRNWGPITFSPSKPTGTHCTRRSVDYCRRAHFPPLDATRNAQTVEQNRGRHERRQLRLQDTTAQQVCFVAARQIGQLRSTTSKPNTHSRTEKVWPLITRAQPTQWPARELLKCRRRYWGIEAGHQRLDMTLDEDRSRVRTVRAMTILGMFRRMVITFACHWLEDPLRHKRKLGTRDFLSHLSADTARRAFALVTSLNPKAWNAK